MGYTVESWDAWMSMPSPGGLSSLSPRSKRPLPIRPASSEKWQATSTMTCCFGRIPPSPINASYWSKKKKTISTLHLGFLPSVGCICFLWHYSVLSQHLYPLLALCLSCWTLNWGDKIRNLCIICTWYTFNKRVENFNLLNHILIA